MVVKPVARAYILSGHMMSSWSVGDWLLRKKWPAIMAMFLALAFHAADYFGAFYTLREVPGVNNTPVAMYQPTLLSSTMSVASMVAFTLSLVCVLTRVHSQLLWMTLRTFDPWAIIACSARGWSARTFSRYWLQQSQSDAGWHSDAGWVHNYIAYGIDLVIILQFSGLLILVEAADIPKDVKRIFVAICLLYCVVISAVTLFWSEMPDWDTDAEVQILFFATMAPKSRLARGGQRY